MSLENSRLYRDLEDREAKIRQIIETVPGLLWSAGPDGEPTQLNQRLLDYSGMRFEDFLRLGWYKFLHPDDLSETANAFSHAMQTGTSYQAVNRLRRADGDYRWHHTRGEPLRDGQGRIIQWYGLSVDIDQGKQAEDRLRRSEAYLAEAQRLSQTGSFGWTPSTGELHWSDETFRILEYDRSIKPTIERVLQRIHPGDCAMMRQLFDETSRGEKDFDVTHRLLMADGSVKFVHVLSHPLKDAAGNLEIFGALMDVTENTCLYRDLAKREAKIRRLVEANIIGVFIGDFDGRILEANDAFLRIVGYDREDLAAGRINWKDLTPRDWRERDARWIEEHKRTGVRLPIEKEYFRKDGSRVPILLGSATVEEGGNQTVTFVLDLSERKQAEAEARESERRYRETQTQLAHANRVATMGQLTASIAHEVNQPIAAALTNAQAALRWLGAEPPNMDEVRQALGRIVRDSDRGGAVVQRIRALIKGTRPREERVEINAAIRDVIEITHGEAMKNGVSVRTELVEGLPLVPGDRIELQQVILNLVLNAIEAMSETSEGPRELLITTGKTESGCWSPCATRARDWRRLLSSISSGPSTRPNRTAWDWGCRSAAQSSRRTADDCGRAPMRPAAPSFNSRCPPRPLRQNLRKIRHCPRPGSDLITSGLDPSADQVLSRKASWPCGRHGRSRNSPLSRFGSFAAFSGNGRYCEDPMRAIGGQGRYPWSA